VAASALVLAAYALLATTLDPGGYLGTDTGAKVATLETMSQRDTWQVDVGYWAERWDADGDLHPLYQTTKTDEGWVVVTTLPMLLAARPLYELGGYRATLILPMLGALLAALACRALARRIAGDRAGWWAFGVVALASPMTVYALDLWEHAPGAGLILAGVVVTLDVADSRRGLAGAAIAGGLFGLAATMRTEALVYGALAFVIALGARWLGSRRTPDVAGLAVAGAAAFALPVLANGLLERLMGGMDRASRASGAGTRLGGEVGQRLEEALITTFSFGVRELAAAVVHGLLAAVLAAVAALLAGRGDKRAWIALVGVAILVLVRLADGASFVPGFAPAFLAAACGAVVAARSGRTARLAAVIALGSLPVVWALQYTGGAQPQWGGRYVLTTSLLLGAIGVAVLASRPEMARVLVGVTITCAAVTLLGVAWLAERSHGVADVFDELVDRPEDVVIVRNGFFVREGGAASVGQHWLSAPSDEQLTAAIAVVRDAGYETFAVLEHGASPPNQAALGDGVEETSAEVVEILGSELALHSYRLAPAS
jgi:hypothetical protein